MSWKSLLAGSLAGLLLRPLSAPASGHFPPHEDGFADGTDLGAGEPPPTLPAPERPRALGLYGPAVSARRQPAGALSNIIVYCSAGHGFTADTNSSAWIVQRPLTNGVVEDMGNLDQLNLFAQYCFNAGATVVPMRPLGYQTNEVVLDNDDSGVTFFGTWYDSVQTQYYGSAGDVPYRYAYVSTNGETACARYRPSLPAAGYYPVYAWARFGSDRVRQLYRIRHAGGETEVRVDHRRVGLGWVWLGTYYFGAGTNGYVDISNNAPGFNPASDVVIADAIRFGNGMGDVDRGFGVSGQPRELECARYWIQRAVGQGMSSAIYDLAGYSDSEDNVGAPRRMTETMNRETAGGFWDRLYLGFHSNAGSGSSRGAMALYDTRYSAGTQQREQDFGQALVDELNNDMEWADNGVLFSDDWTDNTADLYGNTYGELYGMISNEMNNTIIEVAYHDNPDDAKLLRDPIARRVIARACYQAVVKHLHANNSTNVPLALLPDPPTHVRARNSGPGQVTVSWSAPVTNAAGGDPPTGYVVYVSSDGYAFGDPVELAGATNTTAVFTNLATGATWYFQVAAVNAGGESLPSETVGVRVAPAGTAPYLVVNGFDRCDRAQCPTPSFGYNINGPVTLVRPLQINAYDYIVQHGEAIAAAGRFFDSCNHEAVTQDVVRLTNYHAVFWILGEESTSNETFDAAEQARVAAYLGAGGCLFASGAEIAWDLDHKGSPSDRVFITNWFRTSYVSDDANTNRATGAAGSIFAALPTLRFDDGSGPTYNVDYPDVFAASGGAITALVYGSSATGSSAAAVQYSNGYRLVLLGFPFETILDDSLRTDLMARVVGFFGDPADYDGDGDGMPDAWENAHFTNGVAALATEDADGDSANNWSEWVAGTDPTNSSSVFLVTPSPLSGAAAYVISWPSISNRVYAVRWTTNLTAGLSVLASPIAPTPPVNIYTDAVHAAEATVFYDVFVTLP